MLADPVRVFPAFATVTTYGFPFGMFFSCKATVGVVPGTVAVPTFLLVDAFTMFTVYVWLASSLSSDTFTVDAPRRPQLDCTMIVGIPGQTARAMSP